jgi:hypothetical protein
MHGFEKFRPWLGNKIDSLQSAKNRWGGGFSYEILRMMNIPESYSYNHYRDTDGESYQYFNYYTSNEIGVPVSINGYDFELDFKLYPFTSTPDHNMYLINPDTISFCLSPDSLSFEFKKNMKPLFTLNFSTFIKTALDSAGKNPGEEIYSSLPMRFLEKTWENEEVMIKLRFSNLNGTQKRRIYKVSSVQGSCLLRLKKDTK